MNDFQRFHKKALILLSGSFIVLLLGCGAAVAAGQSWLALLLLPGGGFRDAGCLSHPVPAV